MTIHPRSIRFPLVAVLTLLTCGYAGLAVSQGEDVIGPQVEIGDETPPEINYSTLDENCTVSVLNRTVQVSPNGTFEVPNIPASRALARLRVLCIREDGTMLAGLSGFINLSPGTTISLGFIKLGPVIPSIQSLQLEASAASFDDLGSTAQMTVTATLSDGSVEDVTASGLGTSYTSSNSSILSVDSDGLLTPGSSGTAIVSVLNDGVFAALSLNVTLGDDRDSDGLPDDYEVINGLDPDNAADADSDLDSDGLTALEEFEHGTDPNIADTDGDALSDGEEVNTTLTNPILADSDSDGIIDGEEMMVGGDPNASDTDLDGLSDGFELDLTMGASAVDASPTDDPDGDGLSNIDEQDLGTDPLNPDTDNDGTNDGDEVIAGSDPLVAEMDAPLVSLAQPGPSLVVLTEGETIRVQVGVVDDSPIAAVNLLLDGEVLKPLELFSSNGIVSVYLDDFVVPITPSGSTVLTITALDIHGSLGTSEPRTFDVIPDPLTTVVGRVVDELGVPVSGAQVTLFDDELFMTESGADGTFQIDDAPTVLGDVTANATAVIDGVDFEGQGRGVPVLSGITDLGDIEIRDAAFEEDFGALLLPQPPFNGFTQVFFEDGFVFPFFEEIEYSEVLVGSHGILVFSDEGFESFSGSPASDALTAPAKINVYAVRLLNSPPNEGGGIFVNQFPDRVVVTWYRLPYSDIQLPRRVGDVTAQVILFADGRIQMAYNGITTDSTQEYAVGVTSGLNPSGLLLGVYSELVPVISDGTQTVIERRLVEMFDLDGKFLLWHPNAEGGYDISISPIPNAMEPLPSDPAKQSVPK